MLTMPAAAAPLSLTDEQRLELVRLSRPARPAIERCTEVTVWLTDPRRDPLAPALHPHQLELAQPQCRIEKGCGNGRYPATVSRLRCFHQDGAARWRAAHLVISRDEEPTKAKTPRQPDAAGEVPRQAQLRGSGC